MFIIIITIIAVKLWLRLYERIIGCTVTELQSLMCAVFLLFTAFPDPWVPDVEMARLHFLLGL